MGLFGRIYTFTGVMLFVALVFSGCSPDSALRYAPGDRGPGMGVVFHATDQPFPCGPDLSGYCSFLEVAPAGWFDGLSDPVATMTGMRYEYSQLVQDYTATERIGVGGHNTLILSQNKTSSVALAAQYAGGGLRDWYLPSKDELTLLQKSQSLPIGLKPDIYWSSSEYDAWGEFVWVAHMDPPRDASISDQKFIPLYPHLKVDRAYVRPVRAF